MIPGRTNLGNEVFKLVLDIPELRSGQLCSYLAHYLLLFGLSFPVLYYNTYFTVPDEISSLQFDDISDRAVRVSWSPPKKPNGILIGYKLSYEIKDNVETLKEEVLPPNITSVKVEQLQVSVALFICD